MRYKDTLHLFLNQYIQKFENDSPLLTKISLCLDYKYDNNLLYKKISSKYLDWRYPRSNDKSSISAVLIPPICIAKFWTLKPPFFKIRKILKPLFLGLQAWFQETKLWFSNCKIPSILGLTFQLLNPSRKPSKYNFYLKSETFENFQKLQNMVVLMYFK